MIGLDILLRHARIVDVFRLRTFSGWVGMRGDRFIYVEEGDPPAGLSRRDGGGFAGGIPGAGADRLAHAY